jgi:hypothetical protein
MANLFLNIPVPAANGSGVPVDLSSSGYSKTISVTGSFAAAVTIEISNEVAPTKWAPLITFNRPDGITMDVACRWVRATVAGYQSGAPSCDIGSTDDGTLFASLPATPSNGIGAAVDVSGLPLFKTATIGGPFSGSVQLEVSVDGITDWSQLGFGFQNPGQQTQTVAARFMRVVRAGVNPATPGLPIVDVGACALGGGAVGPAGPPGPPGPPGPGGALLSIYGDGSFGDHVTAGDETWTDAGSVPGVPIVPPGAPFPFAFFNNLTVSPGHSVAVGDLSGGDPAVVIFVKGTLTIGAGGRIHVNGGAGGDPFVIGLGRRAIVGSSDGADGAAGNPPFASGPGAAGGSGADRPAQATATMVGGAGGAGGTGLVAPGGSGGVCLAEASWPYSLSQAISIASLLFAIGGGNGGGSGGNSASSISGSGGGGAGTLVIFARTIVAPAGSLQAIGGAGGAGFSFELVPGGGGGGGTGGTIIVVTENATLAGVTDVSGGAAGLSAGFPTSVPTPGGPGEAIGINPTLAMRIPV